MDLAKFHYELEKFFGLHEEILNFVKEDEELVSLREKSLQLRNISFHSTKDCFLRYHKEANHTVQDDDL